MKNEVAVVVGVGPGLGAALVKRLVEEGFTTVAVARRASRAGLKLDQPAGRPTCSIGFPGFDVYPPIRVRFIQGDDLDQWAAWIAALQMQRPSRIAKTQQ